jgi:hypothetical protein
MNHLMQGLLMKEAITNDTVLTVELEFRDSIGRSLKRREDFVMLDCWVDGGQYQLRIKQLIGGRQITIPADSIVALDGMDLGRYIDVYDINPDGSTKRMGKKRGRKPKNTP